MEDVKDICIEVYDCQKNDRYLMQVSRVVKGGVVIEFKEFDASEAQEVAQTTARRYSTKFWANSDFKRFNSYSPLQFMKTVFKVKDDEITLFWSSDKVSNTFLKEFGGCASIYPDL